MLVFVALVHVGALTRIRVRLGVMTCRESQVDVYDFRLDFQNELSQSCGLASFGSPVIF
jgi:hypothetical protein